MLIPACLPSQARKPKNKKCPSYQRQAKARLEAFLKAKREVANTPQAYDLQRPGYEDSPGSPPTRPPLSASSPPYLTG